MLFNGLNNLKRWTIHKIKQEMQKVSNAQKKFNDMERCLQQNYNEKILIHRWEDTETDP